MEPNITISPTHCVFGIKGRVDPLYKGGQKYFLKKRWQFTSVDKCNRIRQTVATMNAELIKYPSYSPIPGNTNPCDCPVIMEKFHPLMKPRPAAFQFSTKPTCNSNYATKCLLRNSGISTDIWPEGQQPYGWDHRMWDCEAVDRNGNQGCSCTRWVAFDKKWCGPAEPLPPDLGDPETVAP